MTNRLTLVYSYYQQPQMLQYQFETWRKYSDLVKSKLNLIIVDDCSPGRLFLEQTGFPVSAYRIMEDKPWHWDGARNLGMHHAEGWCLITDMDHVLEPEYADKLVNASLDGSRWYRINRVRFDGRRIAPHCNTFLMTSKMYWEVGGYDEAITEYDKDRWFRHRLVAKKGFGQTIDCQLRALLPHNVQDASVKMPRIGVSSNPGARPPKIMDFKWQRIQ